MKIKVKIKHLVAALLSLIVLLPLTIFFIIPQIELYSGEKQLAARNAAGKQKILQSLEGNVMNGQKWEIIRQRMIEDGSYGRFDVYVGPSSTQVSHYSEDARFSLEERLPYLKRYLEKGPADGYLVNAARQLSQYYQGKGKLEAADAVLVQGIERMEKSQQSWHQHELQLERAELFIRHNDFTAGRELLNELKVQAEKEQSDLKGNVAALEAEILIREDRMEEAEKLVSGSIEEIKAQFEKERQEVSDDMEGEPVVLSRLQSLQNHLGQALESGESGLSGVKGRIVRSDGTPVSGAGVFLREEDSIQYSVWEGEPYQLLTDGEGQFEFTGVLPGSYQIYLGLTFNQIDGWAYPIPADPWIDLDGSTAEQVEIVLHPLIELKSPVNQTEISADQVTFAWEEVEGAAYYELNLGVDVESGSISSPFKNRIKGTELSVPIEQLYDKSVGITFEGDSWSTVDPVSILAFTNTENRFSWSVKAFNQEGEMITQSNGYRLDEKTLGNLPFFYLKEREMSAADQLFLNKKIPEAYKAYQESYEKNKDAQSLRMLSRLKGWEKEMKGNAASDNYQLQWAEISISPDDAFDMASYYAEKRDWRNYQHWYGKYLEREKAPSEYAAGYHAAVLMKQGKQEEARKAFKKAMELDASNRFIGSWLALELQAGRPFNEAASLAEKYPERSIGSEVRNWASMIRKMAVEAEGNNQDYRRELHEGIQLYLDGREKELEEWLNKTDEEQMKAFVKGVKEVR
ncbi:carboxypeptidase-like regulatory domain-containing protein [Bacillus sp. FJAT-27251]|uniref:carboxypeptidase-like regulatory domain-containing protein n=1 Tax=Bacillus sp. FJAT-27251 TaxID=1684142 RepID=UPI0006A79ABF|nr:carboxypeptidase-like regulatory domain-containing protein [Bacillus sp. FJAT-27251]